MARYAIGIDLGTTNCALAYAELPKRAVAAPTVETFNVPQMMTLSEVDAQALLPSFIYLAGEHDVPAQWARLPWDSGQDGRIVGEAARKQGTLVPGRLVSSAKSWLCHAAVDRKANILPWIGDEMVTKISPVEASACYLRHLRDAWNTRMAEGKESNRLENQLVVITVPASFDEVARDLTVEAAEKAGLKKCTLLEEPQAAFYNWLYDPNHDHVSDLPVGSVCAVIDCGGGTTDFSLIATVEREGQVDFERIAVGDHLLLGGDNMDIALARHVEQRLSPNRRFDSTQWGNVVLASRRVKERMLGANAPERESLTVIGRGSKVIGSSMSCELDRETVRRICLDGFFPNVGFGEEPYAAARGGLTEFGLPFVADPAVTRHLAQFLRQHAEAIRAQDAGRMARPSALLFNGGVFAADSCRQQIVHVMRGWYGPTWDPKILETSSLDLAVARGAAAFAWAKHQGARRIRGGAARSYYVGVADAREAATGRARVLCIVPHGLQEGEEVRIEEPPLELQLGQPVIFPLYTSTVRTQDRAGDLLTVEAGTLAELPSLTTILRGGRRAGMKKVGVAIEAKLTEIGTLELHCAAKEGSNRWKLQFQARLQAPSTVEASTAPEESAVHDLPPTQQTVADIWSEEQLDQARTTIRNAFSSSPGPSEASRINGLAKQLEADLGSSRTTWPMSVLRSLWESLLEIAPRRGLNVDREIRWQNLAGHFLRPGFGDLLDPFRVEQLWRLIHQGVVNGKNDTAWTEYWILCRRVAPGLGQNRQIELSKRLLPYVQAGGPTGKKSPRRVSNNEMSEIWRTLASLEHLPISLKTQLGHSLLNMLKRRPFPRHLFWSLTRLGSRAPLHAPVNVSIPPLTAEKWGEALMAIDLDEERDRPERDFALAQITRCTGDRARDVEDTFRAKVVDFLEAARANAHLIQSVREVTALDRAEQGQLLGDSLPPGLTIALAE
ncbi:MAG: Hsp70 family protein [Planctomycetota bacterium]